MFGIPNLAIGSDTLGIELHLDLDIRGSHAKGASELSGEFRGGGFRRINEAIASIAVAGELFQQVIVVAFPAHTKAVERNALFALVFDLLFEGRGIHIAE